MTAPAFHLLIGYGDTHPTNPAGVSDALRADGGWIGHVARTVMPWIRWAGSEGHSFGVIIDRPFGHWRPGVLDPNATVKVEIKGGSATVTLKHQHLDQYELDSYLWAKASGKWWIWQDFATAWHPICATLPVKAYLGNMAGCPELAGLPPEQFSQRVKDSVQPFVDAYCRGVIIDTGAYAITQPHFNSKGLVRPATVEAFTLMTLDPLFREIAAVEPIPPNHVCYGALWERDCHVSENVYAMFHKRPPAVDRIEEDGYSANTGYVKGKINRWVLPGHIPGPGSDIDRVLKRCHEVVKAGHVPCVPPYLLAGNCKPSDIIGAK